MEATIRRADNGYAVTLRLSPALAPQTRVLKDLGGAFEKIDGFFLEGCWRRYPTRGRLSKPGRRRRIDVDRGLCETCAHYSRHRVGGKIIREGCEVLLEIFERTIFGAGAVRECEHYDADGGAEIPFSTQRK